MNLLLAILLSLPAQASQTAELVLTNGKIVTVDSKMPWAEALAITGQRIVAIGSGAEIARLVGPKTKTIDLGGRLAIPGFIEGHGHFTGVGQSRMILNLSQAKSWDEIVQQVARAANAAPPGKWIVGRGWHQGKWDNPPLPNVEGGYPTHQALSQVSPENPVWLTHGTGHMGFANAKAMAMAGITRQTANPPGGEILRNAAGEAIGVFRETAQGLFNQARATDRSQLTTEQRIQVARREIELAAEECLQKGVTSFQDAGSSFADIDLFKEYAAAGKLPLRLWVMTNEGNRALETRLADYRMIGFGDGYLTVRAIKRMSDGALGTHGAWLLEPYADLPESRGLNTTPLDSIARTAELAKKHGIQLCVHAIGDRANREVLNLFEAAGNNQHTGVKALRWRIEHAQHLNPADIPRFAKLGVIASMQANHCTSDGPFVVDRLGSSRSQQGAYVWKSLLQAGAVVINGTDAPVEDVNPLGSFYASVTRRMHDGRAFFPEECLTREEALKSYTIDAAYAAFEEDTKGSLSVGKLADIVVLTQDIMTIPEDEIPKAEVWRTIVGGQVRYSKPLKKAF